MILTHLILRFLYIVGCSGPWCTAAAASVARIWPEFRVLKGVDCWYCGLGCCWAQPIRWLQWVSTFHIRVHDETVTSQLHYPGNLHMLGFGRAGGRIINDASLSSVREAGRREAPMSSLCTATKFYWWLRLWQVNCNTWAIFTCWDLVGPGGPS